MVRYVFSHTSNLFMSCSIFRLAIPTPLRQLFDYTGPLNGTLYKPGIRIKVPFQGRNLIGILVEITQHTDVPQEKLKPILEILDDQPIITEEIFKLCQWAANYYHHSLGEVLAAALPVLLRKGKKAIYVSEKNWQLTQLGKNQLENANAGEKQLIILNLLAKHSQGLTQKELIHKGAKSLTIKSLHTKNWITASPLPETQTHFNLPFNEHILNKDQELAVKKIQKANHSFQVLMLDGITGSGKTEVYLQAMTAFLPQQILILVPEIGLTPQTIQRFQERFKCKVLALHSGLTDKERLHAWTLAKSGDAKIIIGTRSAIFTPFANLGLIIVDEEHDYSFKQQDSFRYHARDLAIIRAQHNQIPIVLGSATPSLETVHSINRGRYQHLPLPTRAGGAVLPEFQILDLRSLKLESGLSQPLLQAIKEHLHNGNQVILFLNRRGYAPALMCHQCGWIALCKRCERKMTYHLLPKKLHCHYCDNQRSVVTQCDHCHHNNLITVGVGTEKIEDTLKKHFSSFSIARIDRDSTQKKGSMNQLLDAIHRNEHQILIGTQMLAKGHHFPNVTLVAIVDTDSGFYSADFRALERMGQLILQVSGRAGRAEKRGKVIIQTHYPEHPYLKQLLEENYTQFANDLLIERQKASLPPYFFFALFRAEAFTLDHIIHFLQQVKQLQDTPNKSIQLLGPLPALIPKIGGRYRYQLLVQSKQRPLLQAFLKELIPKIEKIKSKHRVRWSLDVDPIEV